MNPQRDSADDLLEYIDRSGGQVWLEGERVRYRLPSGHAQTLERLAAHKDAVRAALRRKTQTHPEATRCTAYPAQPWGALLAALPEALEIVAGDGHGIAWLEYRTVSKCWITTPPVKAERATLEALVSTVATHQPDVLSVALYSARGLHPDVHPARQGAPLRARFTRLEVSA